MSKCKLVCGGCAVGSAIGGAVVDGRDRLDVVVLLDREALEEVKDFPLLVEIVVDYIGVSFQVISGQSRL